VLFCCSDAHLLRNAFSPQGVDTSDATVSVAGTYHTSALSPSGKKVSVGLLMRLEINAADKAFRLTVRAVHPQVSVAIKNIVKSQLT
jgi:hypothetical protein